MLILISEPKSYFSIEKWKSFLRAFRPGARGPLVVLQSLERGLRQLKVPYEINTVPRSPQDVVHVLSSVQATREAIVLKEKGLIKKLIVGPTVAISPLDHNKLLFNPAIDVLIVPSAWVRDFYISQDPSLKPKIKVWAAGVQDLGDPLVPRSKRQQILIYQKNAPEELLRSITHALSDNNVPYSIINYGFFKQVDYFRQLHSSACMIYLSESESQGIALHEAWMHDVPTLVWNRGIWRYEKYQWKDPKISAPYLTDTCGYYFKDAKELLLKLEKLTENYAKLRPRTYSLENFTDIITTKNYLNILSS